MVAKNPQTSRNVRSSWGESTQESSDIAAQLALWARVWANQCHELLLPGMLLRWPIMARPEREQKTTARFSLTLSSAEVFL